MHPPHTHTSPEWWLPGLCVDVVVSAAHVHVCDSPGLSRAKKQEGMALTQQHAEPSQQRGPHGLWKGSDFW
jgi:hypothetical protein